MRRRRLIVLIVALALVFGVGAAVWRLSSIPPAWWAPPAAASPEVQALANRTESAVMEQATHVRSDPAPWTLHLTEAQVNSWLVARLPEWVRHNEGWSWPDDI